MGACDGRKRIDTNEICMSGHWIRICIQNVLNVDLSAYSKDQIHRTKNVLFEVIQPADTNSLYSSLNSRTIANHLGTRLKRCFVLCQSGCLEDGCRRQARGVTNWEDVNRVESSASEKTSDESEGQDHHLKI